MALLADSSLPGSQYCLTGGSLSSTRLNTAGLQTKADHGYRMEAIYSGPEPEHFHIVFCKLRIYFNQTKDDCGKKNESFLLLNFVYGEFE